MMDNSSDEKLIIQKVLERLRVLRNTETRFVKGTRPEHLANPFSQGLQEIDLKLKEFGAMNDAQKSDFFTLLEELEKMDRQGFLEKWEHDRNLIWSKVIAPELNPY